MALSEYERQVLTRIEAEFRQNSRSLQLRVAVSTWWLPVTITLVALAVCAVAGSFLAPGAATFVAALTGSGLGGYWGWVLIGRRFLLIRRRAR